MWPYGKNIIGGGAKTWPWKYIGLPDVPWLKTCTFGNDYYVAIRRLYKRWWGQSMALDIS
jgi:hypothetical protein